MGIEITNQTNNQECGVCVITTLHNFFYPHSKIEKDEVLNLSQINQDGLSIFDFENLSKEFDIGCETYQLTWDEFIQLKLRKPFVLLVTSENNSNHYIIARKQKEYLEIYDSASSTSKKIKYEELKSSFLGILILVDRTTNSFKKKDLNSHRSLLEINIKQIIVSILLYAIVFTFSVIMASFLNWLIDLVILKKSISNLITITFIFALVYILNDLVTYIISLYSSNHLKNNYIFLTSKVLTALSVKTPSFVNKVDSIWIYKIDECIYNIANYCIVEINKFITNIIFVIVCICVVGIINPWLLIFCSIYMLIELGFFFISYSKKKELFSRLLKNENKNTSNYKNLINNLENEFWFSKRNNIIHDIKSHYSNVYKNFSDVNIFRANTTLLKSLLKSVFEIMLYGVIAYLAIKDTNLTIGRITFVIASMNLLKSSTNEIFEFQLYRLEFLTYFQILQDLLKVDNCYHNEVPLELNNVNNLTFVYEGKEINLNINEQINILPTHFINILKNIKEIKVDNQAYSVSDVRLAQSMLVVDEFTQCDVNCLINNFQANPTLYSKYIRYFNLDLNSTRISVYQNFIINLLNLTNEKGKIIVLDSISNLFKEEDISVIKDLLNKLNKNNYCFVVQKE